MSKNLRIFTALKDDERMKKTFLKTHIIVKSIHSLFRMKKNLYNSQNNIINIE